tara:strand:+ start:367 stop:588 length:222 start_codon:yes stop_codon:yes gene_type:complete
MKPAAGTHYGCERELIGANAALHAFADETHHPSRAGDWAPASRHNSNFFIAVSKSRNNAGKDRLEVARRAMTT